MPKAFEQTLLTVSKRYSLQIYVLENGFGGNDALDLDGNVRDPERVAFMRAYIDAMDTAVAKGADVRAVTLSGRCSTISNGMRATVCALA